MNKRESRAITGDRPYGLRERVARWLFNDVIQERVREAVNLSEEDRYWRSLTAGGTRDVSFAAHLENLNDSVEAYRSNPLAFRIVELMVSFVLGRGLRLSATPEVEPFLREWWDHQQNRMSVRQFELMTELSLAGELFITLHTNPFDGMTYLRPVPANLIDQIEIDANDRERELRYHQQGELSTIDGVARAGKVDSSGRWWMADEMRHYSINRIVGAVRGQGDLATILPWLRRYKDWLSDRVLINRYKGAYLWDVTLEGADRRGIISRQAELVSPPKPGSILVHNERETWKPIQPQIAAESVESDGYAIRLMVAAGGGVPLHFLSEGESANRATAREMGMPTLRHYERRQLVVATIFEDLANEAIRRSGRFGEGTWNVKAQFQNLTTEDNLQLASAARSVASALEMAEARGWIGADEARRLFAKFVGEPTGAGE